jgi:hypothetical protein
MSGVFADRLRICGAVTQPAPRKYYTPLARQYGGASAVSRVTTEAVHPSGWSRSVGTEHSCRSTNAARQRRL